MEQMLAPVILKDYWSWEYGKQLTYPARNGQVAKNNENQDLQFINNHLKVEMIPLHLMTETSLLSGWHFIDWTGTI